MDADVVGLVEIENDATSVQNLVDALNAKMGDGAYAQVETGPIGTDAIKVAFIYQPASVAPTGDFAVLDSAVDPAFLDTKNRPVLIQTFTEAAGGERFTAAVAHLKSKGSSCDDVGDPNMGDGQGSCPGTRTAATRTLANYLETDPTGSGDPDYLVLGDLNSYRNEDPIVALEDAGYSDLLETEVGDDAYTFVFDGQLGYLDHAMANASLSRQVSGVTAWHINADEVPLLDYNDPVQDPNEQSFERKSSALPLFLPDAFRSSDHDPVVVGLDLGPVDRPATPVTPGSPPAPAGPTCDADGVFVPPAAQAGVVWTVDPADSTGPGTYGVTAAPAEGYTFPSGAQTTWEIIVGARLTEGCTPPVPPLVTPPVTPPVVTPPVDADKAVAVRVRAVAGGKKLYVNVNPNKGRGYWQFTVQKLVNGKWRTQSKVYKTSGKYETRRLRLAKGTYRVVVLPRYGYAGATSEVVSLRSAPAAVVHPDRGVAASVKVRAVSGRSKLHVNVNPNKGRGYWQFAVQKYTKGKWRALPKVYKTTKRIETRRLNLERGKYRVVVMSRYGYDGVVSDTVRLRR
jgi:hypothetical protein